MVVQTHMMVMHTHTQHTLKHPLVQTHPHNTNIPAPGMPAADAAPTRARVSLHTPSLGPNLSLEPCASALSSRCAARCSNHATTRATLSACGACGACGVHGVDDGGLRRKHGIVAHEKHIPTVPTVSTIPIQHIILRKQISSLLLVGACIPTSSGSRPTQPTRKGAIWYTIQKVQQLPGGSFQLEFLGSILQPNIAGTCMQLSRCLLMQLLCTVGCDARKLEHGVCGGSCTSHEL